MKQFDKLIQISPYPVKIEHLPFRYSGGFWYGSSNGHVPYQEKDFNPYIAISPLIKLPTFQIATLVHEIGHAIHYKRHCVCYTTHRELAEYHAELFALRFLLRYKLKGALRIKIKYIKKYACSNILSGLFKMKIWKRCLEYL